MKIRVLAASSSTLRRNWYRDQLEQRGCDVRVAATGVSCIELAEEYSPDIVILESFLTWGGAEGVLAVRHETPCLRTIPVIVIDAQRDASQTYRISAYQLAGYWKSQPTVDELLLAIRLTLGKEGRSRAFKVEPTESAIR